MLARLPDERIEPWPAGLRARARSLRSDERGAAILTVMIMVTVGLAVGAVAAITATNAMRGSLRDESSKDALAAADAGAQMALQRQNQVEVSGSFPCVSSAAGSMVAGPVGEGGWCPAFDGATGDAGYSYRVRPAVETELLSRVEVVATGTSQGVTRRIHVTAESPRANAIFANSTVIGDDFINLESNSRVFGNAGTNGNIVMSGNSRLCGVAQYGDGGALDLNNNATHGGTGCPQTTYPANSGTVSLPPIDQGTVAEANSNFRINPSDPAAPDTISGNRGDVSWNPNTRTLIIGSNSALTLGGEDYSFCRLELRSNSALIVAAGAKVRLFFDSPENCGLTGTSPQILLSSNSQLTTTDGKPASLQILVVGSENPAVQTDNVVLNSNTKTTMPVVLYAPNSAIEMDSNATLLGAVAGASVDVESNSTVTSHVDSSSLELPLPLHYRQTQFVECGSTPAPAAAPSSSC